MNICILCLTETTDTYCCEVNCLFSLDDFIKSVKWYKLQQEADFLSNLQKQPEKASAYAAQKIQRIKSLVSRFGSK